MIIENTTPIAALTVGDLKELLLEFGIHTKTEAVKSVSGGARRYVYGLKGIQSLFGCSHLTAALQGHLPRPRRHAAGPQDRHRRRDGCGTLQDP